MTALEATAMAVAQPHSTSPRTPPTPDLEPPHSKPCKHPFSDQSIDALDDGQYTRSCRCGAVLDHWQSASAMQAGLEQVAAARGTSVETIRGELAVDD
jgi:hypothetical protein